MAREGCRAEHYAGPQSRNGYGAAAVRLSELRAVRRLGRSQGRRELELRDGIGRGGALAGRRRQLGGLVA